jgi:hypothetical protein
MKSKKNIILIVLLLTLILGGGYFFVSKNKVSNLSDTSLNKKDSGLFTSIKDALNKDLTLACEFKDENASFKSYIKNGAVRVTTEGTQDGQSGEMIMKDNKMYIWDIKTNEGFVYDIPKEENGESQKVGMTGSEIADSKSYLDLIDKYKDSCKVATVEDSFFVAPSGVKFQDMSKFLEDLQKQVPSYNIPTE